MPTDVMTSVFGKEQTPREVFSRSREENAGAAVPMQPVPAGLLCPARVGDAECGQPIMIFPSKPGFTCRANPDHHWPDMTELKALNPRQVKIEPRVHKQPGLQDVTVQIPGAMIEQLRAKFGDKLGATLAAVLRNLVDGETMTVPSSDKKQLEIWLGGDIKHSGMLKGMVFNLLQTRNELQTRLTAIEASGGKTGGGYEVPFTAAEVQQLEERARAHDKPGWAALVRDKVMEFVKNGWV